MLHDDGLRLARARPSEHAPVQVSLGPALHCRARKSKLWTLRCPKFLRRDVLDRVEDIAGTRWRRPCRGLDRRMRPRPVAQHVSNGPLAEEVMLSPGAAAQGSSRHVCRRQAVGLVAEVILPECRLRSTCRRSRRTRHRLVITPQLQIRARVAGRCRTFERRIDFGLVAQELLGRELLARAVEQRGRLSRGERAEGDVAVRGHAAQKATQHGVFFRGDRGAARETTDAADGADADAGDGTRAIGTAACCTRAGASDTTDCAAA